MKLVRLGVAVALIALAVPVIAQIRFPDVPDDHERADSIRWAVAEGLFRGYPDGSFKPGRELSENEFRIVIRRLYDRYDSWTRADVAHFLRYGIDGLQPAPTAPTTTRPATPTTTRESVIYYTARGAEWATRAADHYPKQKTAAAVAYRLATAAYSAACGELYAAGWFTYYDGRRPLTSADYSTDPADYSTDPAFAGYAALRGFCEGSYLYMHTRWAVFEPLAYNDHGHDATSHDELAALATKYAAAGAAALTAYYTIATDSTINPRRPAGSGSYGGVVQYDVATSNALWATEDAARHPQYWSSYYDYDHTAAEAAVVAEYAAAAAEYAAEYAAAARRAAAEYAAAAAEYAAPGDLAQAAALAKLSAGFAAAAAEFAAAAAAYGTDEYAALFQQADDTLYAAGAAYWGWPDR